MSNFSDTVQQDTPRLVVMFRREGDKEMFQWGIVGIAPILTLIGCISRVQGQIVGDAWIDECDQQALVIAWGGVKKGFTTFVHPDIPEDSLVGMLETIKFTLVGSHMGRQVANQQVILGPDGRPAQRTALGGM